MAAALVKQPHAWCLSARPQLPVSFRPKPLQNGSQKRVSSSPVCISEDFDFRAGPLEDIKPKFIRSGYPSLLDTVQTEASPETGKRRGRRRFRKATPVQAISGALIGGGCTLLAFKFARQAYEHLESHPPAHDLPMHLDSEVNQLMLTVVAGFGGLVVCMFGVSCVGLGLLSVQLLKAPKTPPNAP